MQHSFYLAAATVAGVEGGCTYGVEAKKQKDVKRVASATRQHEHKETKVRGDPGLNNRLSTCITAGHGVSVRLRVFLADSKSGKTPQRLLNLKGLGDCCRDGVTIVLSCIQARKSVKALLYLRTSGDDGKDKAGLPVQRGDCATFAARAGYEIVAKFADDGVTGKFPMHSRPQGRMLIAA